MKFERKLSVANTPVVDQIKWKTIPVKLTNSNGETIFEMNEVEVPAHWSNMAAQILATKYFRRAGVPVPHNRLPKNRDETDIPEWLRSCFDGTIHDEKGSETSAKQVFHRLAGAWTYHGWKMGLFRGDPNKDSQGIGYNSEKDAQIFYDELFLILAKQLAAPASPQWFNTGLWWAYGIEGSESGSWAINYDMKKGIVGQAFETKNAYEYPQVHACFIQPVNDDLCNPGGIMDLWQREVRLFKGGSGTGSNFSNIRAKGEKLSGGGVSSGLMSFLEIGDRAAGAIKSGGTTRRAAKMVIVDADHPEVEDFIWWKAREEQKAAAMWIGSKMMREHYGYLSENSLVPGATINQRNNNIKMEEFGIGYEGEAIRTVGGQNANNSVRLTDDFMERVETNQGWSLFARKDSNREIPTKTLAARDLFNQICRAAWASGDPGLQFHDTINKWHTCKADGQINASNPCSEYMFLDNTACNLASLNLGAFLINKDLRQPLGEFDVDLFCHVAKLMTCVLDISVTMASFPSKEIALGSYNYRTLGLGYTNLGGLLMRMGLSYDSNIGRAVAESITALMTGISYKTSINLANELESFPRWEANIESMKEVIISHREKARILHDPTIIGIEACRIWNWIYDHCNEGFRNAQTTLLAPTGTIGLLMDCDTLGIEPEYNFNKVKNLAGGGTITFTNNSIEEGLVRLGYKAHIRNLITAHVKANGTFTGCKELEAEHFPVFACAVDIGENSLSPLAHVKMVAAVQPFLSGAVSKTVNLPNNAMVKDFAEVYMEAWKLGLKAVAPYRDGAKLAQPLNTGKPNANEKALLRKETKTKTEAKVLREISTTSPSSDNYERNEPNPFETAFSGRGIGELNRGEREYLPWKRTVAYNQKVNIGPNGESVFLGVSKYPDGRPGEVFLRLSRSGPTLSALLDMTAMCISIGLQYGVPVSEFVDRLKDRKFDPSGLVEGHDQIKWAASIADFLARELGLEFLNRTEMGQVSLETDPLKPTIDWRIKAEELVDSNYPKPIKAVRDICPTCHEPCLIRSGTCQTCTSCGYNDGCGG